MSKGLVDFMSRPDEESADFASGDEALPPEDAQPPKADPDALLSSIESQIAQLRGLMAGM